MNTTTTTTTTMNRRSFLERTGMCLGGVATFGFPTVRFASVPEPGRLVFVLLRGGFDGLAAVVPIGDGAYADLRGPMALEPDALTPLGDGFALAPGLAPLRTFWDAGELVALHAMAIPFRTRSHFDGQAVLETGLDRIEGSAEGWLNRLLQVMEGERAGIAVAAGMPRSMVGNYPVSTWSPTELGVVDDAYLERLHLLYRHDRRLFNRFEAAVQQTQLAEEGGGAMESVGGGGAIGEGAERDRAMSGAEGDLAGGRPDGEARGGANAADRARRRGTDVASLFRAAARLLRPATGPNVAAMELSGWDTHANQGLAGGALDRLLGRLADGLVAFRDEMDAAWANTTVVVMTEFGRTARPNGTRGTDHGTAGAGFILGPRVARSAVVADWPGLGERALYEGRDLKPTLDTRSVLKGIIRGAFDLTPGQADRVFPGSAGVPGRHDLMG